MLHKVEIVAFLSQFVDFKVMPKAGRAMGHGPQTDSVQTFLN
jgi:hypothetical protein